MPVTQKTYPDWVQKFRTKGKTVKKKGNSYYLYSRTSKRIPGKKYPQPVDTYIGIITPDGIVETNKKKIVLTDIVVWEYGFSKTIMDLCPRSWKDPLGKDWEDILKILICQWSENSYLKIQNLKKREDFRCQFSTQASALNRRMYKEYSIKLEELQPLKYIYLLEMGKEKAISKINPDQRDILDRLGLELEVR